MKKYVLIILTIILYQNCHGNGIGKPVIHFSLNSDHSLLYTEDVLYPDRICDGLTVSIDQTWTKIVRLKNKIRFSYIGYNMYASNPEDLKRIKVSNALSLYIKPSPVHRFTFSIQPAYSYFSLENDITFSNTLSYTLNFKVFKLLLIYNNKINFNIETQIRHGIKLNIYWMFPNIPFIKYRTSCTVGIKHFFENENKIYSPVDDVSIKFDMIIDFNKLSFEKLFPDDEL